MGNIIGKKQKGCKGLDAFTKTRGLYESIFWEPKKVRKMILDRQLAPIFPGGEEKALHLSECPICFFYYPGNMNVSTCCEQQICTECYLQIVPPREKVCCPFCNQQGFGVSYNDFSPDVDLKKLVERSHLGQEVEIPSPKPDVKYASVYDRKLIQRDASEQAVTVAVEQIANEVSQRPAHDWENIFNSMGSTQVQRIEKMMFMEAIRLSMLETQNKEVCLDTQVVQHGNNEPINDRSRRPLNSDQSVEEPNSNEKRPLSSSENMEYGGYLKSIDSIKEPENERTISPANKLMCVVRSRTKSKSDSSLSNISLSMRSIGRLINSRDDQEVS